MESPNQSTYGKRPENPMNDILDSTLIEGLLHFNDRIDPLRPADLCEPDLLNLIDTLYNLELGLCGTAAAACFWLTAARVAELALLCAGNYADCAEFTLAGDLLVNPLKIEIDFNESRKPVLKWRHGRFSDQVAEALDLDPTGSMKTGGAYPVIRRPALLPELRQRLDAGGMLSTDYLQSIDRRMESITETLSFMAAWQIRDGADLCLRIKAAKGHEKCLVQNALCRFQSGIFQRIGTDLRRIANRRQAWSGFLAAVPLRETACFLGLSLCQN